VRPREASGGDRIEADPVVRIAHGTAFELLAQLSAFTSGPARASLESGKPWIRETRRLAGPELIARATAHVLDTYVNLATLTVEMGDDVAVGDFLSGLRALPPAPVRRRVIGGDSARLCETLDDQTIERAATGDPRARASLRAALGHDPAMWRSVDRLLRVTAHDLQRDLGEILEAWHERVFPRWAEDSMAAIRRDVAAKAELLAGASPKEFVDAATAGLAFEPAAWVRQIVIVPGVALRPFVVPMDFDGTQLFLVSVADESLDPEGVVSNRLAKVAAALGDPLRMRTLRELAREPGLTAGALAERMRVERTSLQHHLGLLRSAGLLAIEDRGDGSWHYSVRRDRIDDLGSLLGSYLDDAPRGGAIRGT
jgi:DNA-binding transcriptional ArsR family regulator